MKRTQAFTLVEILVVIAILAGLVAILFPNFMDIRQRARDAQRKSDLKQIQKALEYYKQDQNPPLYPPNYTLPAPGALWTSGTGNVYMTKMPGDPSGPCSTGNNQYYYWRQDGVGYDGLAYMLYACLENASDPDAVTCTPTAPYFQDITSCPCPTNKCYKVVNP